MATMTQAGTETVEPNRKYRVDPAKKVLIPLSSSYPSKGPRRGFFGGWRAF